MTDPMPDRCPAIEPGFGVLERCVFHVGHGGYHLAGGAWPIEETTRRCTAAGAVTGGRCVLPGGHDEDDGTAHLFAVPGGSAQAVEGSTPIASPAPERCDAKLSAATGDDDDLHCERLESHTGRHLDGGLTWIGDDPDTVGLEPVGCPRCGTILNATAANCADPWHHDNRPTAADEPVPVPPPVDALLVLLDKWLEEDVDDHTANGWAAIREDIETRARALWAAGVAEGRRLLDETAATAAVHAYELGITGGRRQATEERTEEQTRDEEWGLRYKVNGLQREAGDGGHVFSDRDEAELHITTWRQHYPGLTYSDVEYMRRETFTGPWVADHG